MGMQLYSMLFTGYSGTERSVTVPTIANNKNMKVFPW